MMLDMGDMDRRALLMRALLLAGASPNASNHKGRRPLHMAVHAQQYVGQLVYPVNTHTHT